MNAPPPDCLHPTRTEVIIDISWRTRAAILLQQQLSGSLRPAFLQQTAFVGPLFVGAPVRPNMLNMPKSASECVTLPVLSDSVNGELSMLMT